MVKVKDLKKDKKKYQVTLLINEREEHYQVSEDLVVFFRLLKGKELTDSNYQEFQDYVEMDDAMQKMISYALRKKRSVRECHQMLDQYEIINPDHRRKIMHHLHKLQLLDDEALAYHLIEIEVNQKWSGPKKIEQVLSLRGLKPDQYIDVISKMTQSKLDENLQRLFDKKQSSFSKQPKMKTMTSFKQYLLQKGYRYDEIDSFISSHESQFAQTDEEKLIQKEIVKLKSKYQKTTLNPYEVKHKMMETLLRKGYTYEIIKNAIERGNQ